MKLRLIRCVSVLITVILVFSGCSLIDFFSAESLLKPPKLTGENAALQDAFEKTVGKDVTLFTPIAGEYRASYIIFDSNNDDIDEAVVFYSLNSNKSVVHMHLLTKNEDTWYSVSDIIGSGTEVYKVDFFNIDNTNSLEIAVTWSVEDSKKEKTLSIYRIGSVVNSEKSVLTSLATIQIADYIYLDLDADSINELFYLYYTTSSSMPVVVARVLDYNMTEENLVPVSDVILNSQISSFSQIVWDKEGANYRIYLDCLSADSLYFTELVVFDFEKDALVVPLFDGHAVSEISTRQKNIGCSDYNNDGYIDIPGSLISEDSYIVNLPESNKSTLNFICWYTYFENEFSLLGKYLINSFDEYTLNLTEYFDNCYFVYDYSSNVIQTRLKNLNEENNIIFSVKYKKYANGHGLLLESEKRNEFLITVTAKGYEMNITQAKIRDLIKEGI